jgi:DNA-binding LacI/PurR family transcriptional regulator
MDHLLQLGHWNIAYIDYGQELRQTIYDAYRKLLEETGHFEKRFVHLGEFGSLLITGTEFVVKAKGEITACFTPYDYFAIYFLENLVSYYNYKIPEDLAIVGFDDIYESSKPTVSLTTVRQPKEEIVRKALELLLDSSPDDSSVLIEIKPELVIRKSTDSHYLKDKKKEEVEIIGNLERRWAI